MPPKKSSVDHELIRDLARLLTETNLTEIEIQGAEHRVRVARMPGGTVIRKPLPPASMRNVSLRARGFSTILSGSDRSATRCIRSAVASGFGLGRADLRKPKGMARNIDDSARIGRKTKAAPFDAALSIVHARGLSSRWNPCANAGQAWSGNVRP